MIIIRNQKILLSFIVLVAIIFFGYLVHLVLYKYNYQDIINGLQHITTTHLIFAAIFCLLNYFVLTLYDTLSISYLGRSLQYHRIALASFVSYTFSHNIGFAALSGGATRLRFYSRWNFTPTEVAQLLLFSALNFWLGLLILGALTAFISPDSFGEALHLSSKEVILLGILLSLPVLTYLTALLRWQGTRNIFGKEFRIPSRKLAIKSILVAIIDWLLAAIVLYSLLPDQNQVSFLMLLTTFIAAQLAGVISNIPGGLGVFETVVVVSLGHIIPKPTLIAVLLIFRCVYYLVPFILGLLLFALYELKINALFLKGLANQSKNLNPILSAVFPLALSIGTFIGGVVLLCSSASPTIPARLEVISSLLPLGLIEASHFINSLIGIALIFLSWSIKKRLSAGRGMAILLTSTGVIVSILKGYDFEEAFYCLLLFTGFVLSKKYFYRKSSIFSSLNTQTVLAAFGVLICSIWLGIFSYKHIEYTHDLWWQFTLESEASRFLRASVGASIAILLLLLRILFRPKANPFRTPSQESLFSANKIIQASSVTEGHLALLADKELLFDAQESAFIMYRSTPRSFIALSDPVGNKEAFSELIWDFRERCDSHDSICAFYEVSSEFLPHYIDVGLKLIKLGEEAQVSLETFSLNGASSKTFRHTLNKFEKEGFSFAVISAKEAQAIMPQLQEISNEWLGKKNTSEKGFSLGYFSTDYLSYFPIGVVYKDSSIFGFANILATANKTELSVDLMRYRSSAPNGLMDFLFLQLMLWGQDQGYQEFNLGMAPLFGLEPHKFASKWSKLGGYMFRHGEHFYNFEGLRNYKNKFSPRWQPKYLAHSAGILLPLVLGDIVTLISGGVSKIIKK